MTALALDRIPVDDITERARQIRFGKTILNVIAAVLFAVAWIVAKGFGVAWLCAAWCFAAAELGWRQGRGKDDLLLPSKATLAAENASLREELRRRGG